jgi:hypothetical protein
VPQRLHPLTRIEPILDAAEGGMHPMPIAVGEVSSFCDMACSLFLVPLPAFVAGRAGARPDHPISRRSASTRSCAIWSALPGGQNEDTRWWTFAFWAHRKAFSRKAL